MGKLTPELRKALKLQYPNDITTEVRGEIVHFKDTRENWKKLAKGLGLAVFKEERGNRNWVLYNPKNFKIAEVLDRKYLKCISEENLELPINCSSCCYMFCNFKFNNKDALKNFDTSEIKDMCYMFVDCSFPEGFSLGNKFDTSNVKDMCGMFSNCTFPSLFLLGDKFDTSNVKDMGYMFYNCTFSNNFSLGNKFDISSTEDRFGMFFDCKLPEGKTARDFNDEYGKVFEWLKSRKPKSSNNTSNTNFFN